MPSELAEPAPAIVSRVRRFLATKRARGLDEDTGIALVRIAQAAEGDGLSLPSFGLDARPGGRPVVVGMLWRHESDRLLELVVAGWYAAKRRPIAYWTAGVGEVPARSEPEGEGHLGESVDQHGRPIGWVEELRGLLDWTHGGPGRAVRSAGGLAGVDQRGW